MSVLHLAGVNLQYVVRDMFTSKIDPLATFASLTSLPEDILSEGILPYLLTCDTLEVRRVVKGEISRQLIWKEMADKCRRAFRG
ncbi:hypothetical protein TrCOL_g7439 [Triparma columacea]|uniref:Uncharacterized protein n=1 Tax=Triparma columacea TaxID=722753 RepID=A0A9W7GNW1_9STRA|nr:hypothetical protein TrCOL_g7439 [Triparma columacea]